MSILLRATTVVALMFIWAGCATTGTAGGSYTAADEDQAAGKTETASDEAKTAEDDSEDKAAKRAMKRAKLVRELAIAKEKVTKAQLAIAHQDAGDAESMSKAEVEHELALKKLGNFDERDAPARLEKAGLDLRRSQDRLQEAEEELAQLEMMYTENDLADKTAEIVLRRGKRRIQRSRADLAIKQKGLQTLEQRTLPLEGEELRSTLSQKMHAIENARRQTASNALDKRIELMSAEAEIARIEAEIAEIDAKLDKESGT